MIERAVDNRVETVLQTLELRCVGHLEVHRNTGDPGVLLRALDCGRRGVDSSRRVALGSEVNGVMARPGTRVENLALDGAQRDELLHDLLRTADVPRSRCRQALRDLLIAVHLLVAARIGLCGLGHPPKIKRSMM